MCSDYNQRDRHVRVLLALVVGCGLILTAGLYARAGDERTATRERQVKEASDSPGVRISTGELAALLYGDEPVPAFEAQDGDERRGVPLTFDMLTKILLSGSNPLGPDALPNSAIDQVQEDNYLVTAALSPAQVTELAFFGKTSVKALHPRMVRFVSATADAAGQERYTQQNDDEADYSGRAQETIQVEDVLQGAGTPHPKAGCAFVVVCDDEGACELRCTGSCQGGSCAVVTRPSPSGGTRTTCECVQTPQ